MNLLILVALAIICGVAAGTLAMPQAVRYVLIVVAVLCGVIAMVQLLGGLDSSLPSSIN